MPKTANANNAIGATQIGRFNERRNAGTSKNGTMAISIAVAKIAGSDVDQGSESATKIAKTSTAVAQLAGLRHRMIGSAIFDFSLIAFTACLVVPDRPARSY